MPTSVLCQWFLRVVPCAIFLALTFAAPDCKARQAISLEDRAGLARPLGGNGKITPDEAVQILFRKIGRSMGKKSHLAFDRTEDREGRSYHVVHGYEVVVDDPKTGDGHTATWGWFFVDQKTGTAYKWDLAEDKLIPF